MSSASAPTLFLFTRALWLLHLGHCFVQLDLTRHLPHDLSKRDVGSEVTLDNVISYYRADIYIGTPPQPVSVQIDTGSSDLWVISRDNPLCRSRLKCPEQAMFDTRHSSTFHRNDSVPFSIAYGDSTYANGTFAQDKIQIGGHTKHSEQMIDERASIPEFTVTDANFAVAETSNSTEAVWGIGMESTESMARIVDANGHISPTYPNLPVQMKQQGLISTVSYSLWLNDIHSSTGSLLFGGVDHAKYLDQLQTVPMVSSYHGIGFPMDFSVMLHGISAYNAQNSSASVVNCSLPFLLDSGTTYSQMPPEFLSPIMDTIGAVLDETGGFYLLNQEQRAALSGGGLMFNLSGIEISVSFDELLIPIGSVRSAGRHNRVMGISQGDSSEYSSDFIEHLIKGEDDILLEPSGGSDIASESNKARRRSRNIYLVGLYAANPNAGGAYILGDTFLRSAYVVYDLENKEISLANTNYNSTDSRIESIDSSGVPNAIRAPAFSKTLVVSEFATFVASELYASTGDFQDKTQTFGTSGLATISQIPSHAAPGASSATTSRGSALTHHAKHNGGMHLAPLPRAALVGAALVLPLLV